MTEVSFKDGEVTVVGGDNITSDRSVPSVLLYCILEELKRQNEMISSIHDWGTAQAR